MEAEHKELTSLLESAEKTSKTIQNLLEDPESYEENKQSIFLLTKKYKDKLIQALKTLKPDYDEQEETRKKEEQKEEKEKPKLEKINFEYFPNPICVSIWRSLSPLNLPVDLNSETTTEETPLQGPFLYKHVTENSTVYASFIGQLHQGEPKGFGRMIYDNGNIIEGQFEGLKLHGYGRIINWDGSYIEGNFKQGVPEGKCFSTNFPNMVGQLSETKVSYQGK